MVLRIPRLNLISRKRNYCNVCRNQLMSDKWQSRRLKLEISRIAFGKKVVDSECRLIYLPSSMIMELSFEKNVRCTRNSRSRFRERFRFNLVNELKALDYFLNENRDGFETLPSFLCMEIQISRGNGLEVYSNSYKPASSELERRDIVIEFRFDDDLAQLIEVMKSTREMQKIILDSSELSKEKIRDCCRSLKYDDEVKAKQSVSHVYKLKRTGFLTGKCNEDTLFVYPFPGDSEIINCAADGLQELSMFIKQKSARTKNTRKITAVPDISHFAIINQAKTEALHADSIEGSSTILTVRVSDYERLDAPKYLNDTLIDFWMQWYVDFQKRYFRLLLNLNFMPILQDDSRYELF